MAVNLVGYAFKDLESQQLSQHVHRGNGITCQADAFTQEAAFPHHDVCWRAPHSQFNAGTGFAEDSNKKFAV